jgi:hypothetical protein
VTWNPDDKSVNITLSNGDRLATKSQTNGGGVRSTLSHTSGKKYFEIDIITPGSGDFAVGAGLVGNTFGGRLGATTESFGFDVVGMYHFNSSFSAGQGPAFTDGDRMQVAVDLTANLVWCRKNGTGNWNNDAGADPVAGTIGRAFATMPAGEKFIQGNMYYPDAAQLICADEAHQLYPAPAGFTPWDISIPVTTTWNPADTSSGMVLSNGDLTVTHEGASGWLFSQAIASSDAGKYYFELTIDVFGASGDTTPGITGDTDPTSRLGDNSASVGLLLSSKTIRCGGADIATVSAVNFVNGDVIGMAFDLTNKLVWANVNGGIWNNSATADPETGTEGGTFAALHSPPWLPTIVQYWINSAFTANFGATPYAGTPPAGFGNWGEE